VKVLFIGNLAEGQTSLMRMEVLRELGHNISSLSTEVYWASAHVITRRLQKSLGRGGVVEKINSEFIEAVRRSRPDIIWAEKQEYFKPEVLREISGMGIKIIHYTPDPYFSLSWKRTKLLDECLPLYDCLITSKKYELEEYHKVNSNVIYIPLGFSDSVHRPSLTNDPAVRERYASDVSFIGGWEPRREEDLNALMRDVNCTLKIWGYGWEFLQDGHWTPRRWWAMRRNAGREKFTIKVNPLLSQAIQGDGAYGGEYARALSGAKINIGFLRKICPDQHTTRTFEIPACGSLLLADRSVEHSEFFKEGEEADYFSSKEEMIDKVQFYLSNESARKRIAINGFNRCQTSGYSYKEILKKSFDEIQALGIV